MSRKITSDIDPVCGIIQDCPFAYWLTVADISFSEDQWENAKEGCPCRIKVSDFDAGRDEFFCSAKSTKSQ